MFDKKRNEIVLSKANLLAFQLVWRSVVYVWGTDKINLIHMTLFSVDGDGNYTTKIFTVSTVVEYLGIVTEVEVKMELLKNQMGQWVVSNEPEMIFPSRKSLHNYKIRPSFYSALASGEDLKHRGYDDSGNSFSSDSSEDKLPWIRKVLTVG